LPETTLISDACCASDQIGDEPASRLENWGVLYRE